jgi:adenylate kinase family enzyme
VKRVVVLGNSGSGKTTLAAELAGIMGCGHIELDAIRHLPGWVEIDRETFRRVVDERTSAASWVLCGNASAVADIALSRADTVVVFDLPRWLVMARVLRRTIKRAVLHQELWNGNRETLRNVLALGDPHRSIVAWAWTQHHRYRGMYLALSRRQEMVGKEFVFLRTRGDARRFLATAAALAP